MIRHSLSSAGYRVQVVSNGEEALAQATAETPDLILSDVMMPGTDGYELCRRLRADPSASGVPIILLTSRGGIAEKRRGFEAGADDYLVKPADPVELRMRIAALLVRSRAWAAEDAAPSSLGRLIVVFSVRGGAGATSVAVIWPWLWLECGERRFL